LRRRAVVLSVLGAWAAIAFGSIAMAGLVVLAGLGGGLGGDCASTGTGADGAGAGGAGAGGAGAGDAGAVGGAGGGGAPDGRGRSWSAEQTGHARTIIQVAAQRGLPRRAAVIAVSTAIVESQLHNVNYGDRDSIGLFQQRPSQGWGPPRELLEPVLAAQKFYDALLALPQWAFAPPGVAAQAVQRSAFPLRYAPEEPAAAALVARYWIGPDAPAGQAPAGQASAGQASAAKGPGGAAPVGAAPVAADPARAGPAGVADASADAALLASICADQGGADLPTRPGTTVEPTRLPPGFVLPVDPVRRAVVSAALAQVGKPYVWGAKGPDAFDCSGLTQTAWAGAGVVIPAGTIAQIRDGTAVADLADAAPGDLLFIPGSLGTVAVPRHVGIYAGNGLVVDARSARRGVMISSLDDWRGDVVAIRRITGPDPRPG
jgi:cell wall-associated NlpC family hydrolase